MMLQVENNHMSSFYKLYAKHRPSVKLASGYLSKVQMKHTWILPLELSPIPKTLD